MEHEYLDPRFIMFTTIIDTPGKTKLAAFFLNTHSRAFHPEEIRKATLEPGPSIATTLRHFVKNGFLKSVERRGEVYYRLNPRYNFLEELKGFLVKKSPARFRDLVWHELEKINNATLVVLTGIFTGQAAMPTDLVIVGKANAISVRKAVERIEKDMRLDLNYTIFSEDEFSERFNMHERFMRDLFENPHLIVLDKRPKTSKSKKEQILLRKSI